MLAVYEIDPSNICKPQYIGEIDHLNSKFDNLFEMVADHKDEDARLYEVITATKDRIIIDAGYDIETYMGDAPVCHEIQIKASASN